MTMKISETVRVSTALWRLVEDPSSMPADQPHCLWCGTPRPKEHVKRKCEVCQQLGTCTGPRKVTQRVWIEEVGNV